MKFLIERRLEMLSELKILRENDGRIEGWDYKIGNENEIKRKGIRNFW